MSRITTATGSAGQGPQVFSYNPVAIECEDSVYQTLQPCLGSETVIYKRPYDNRPVHMIWKGWDYDHITFSGFMNVLTSGIGRTYYLNIGHIQPLFKTIFATGWIGPYRFVNLTTTPSSAGGKSWEEVKLTVQYAG